MEKIKKRDFRYYCAAQVLASVTAVLTVIAGLLAIIPVIGIVFGAIFGLIAAISAVASAAASVFFVVYQIYFYYQLSLDVNAVCEGDGLETKSYLFVSALNAATFGIYGKYWIYKTAQRLQANAPRYGFKMIVGGKEVLVLDLFSGGLISTWELVRNMNKIAKVYNEQGVPELVGGVQ